MCTPHSKYILRISKTQIWVSTKFTTNTFHTNPRDRKKKVKVYKQHLKMLGSKKERIINGLSLEANVMKEKRDQRFRKAGVKKMAQ